MSRKHTKVLTLAQNLEMLTNSFDEDDETEFAYIINVSLKHHYFLYEKEDIDEEVLEQVKPISRKKLPDYTKVHQEILIIFVHCNPGYGSNFDVYCVNSRQGENNGDLTLEQSSYRND